MTAGSRRRRVSIRVGGVRISRSGAWENLNRVQQARCKQWQQNACVSSGTVAASVGRLNERDALTGQARSTVDLRS